MATDCRYSLRELQPSADDRKEPYPSWWVRGAGVPYPKGVSGMLVNNLMDQAGDHLVSSVLIKRDAADARNLSGGVETFVPKRLLLGVIPQALLDTVRARPGGLRALSILHIKSVLYGAFAWAHRPLNDPKRRFPARAVPFLAGRGARADRGAERQRPPRRRGP